MSNQFTYKTPEQQIEAFWNRVDRSGGENSCWLWTSSRKKGGYGGISWKGKQDRAHRIAYSLTYGEIPDGLYVLHECDNPPCCNPKHLFLGTHLENMQDRDRKGRNINRAGEDHPMCVLSDDQVTTIRLRYASGEFSLKQIGAEYNVSETLIGLIIRYKLRVLDANGIPLPIIDRPNKADRKMKYKHLTDFEKVEIYRLHQAGFSSRNLAAQFGVSRISIMNAVHAIAETT